MTVKDTLDAILNELREIRKLMTVGSQPQGVPPEIAEYMRKIVENMPDNGDPMTVAVKNLIKNLR